AIFRDGGHLDEIRASCNGFFETMEGRGHGCRSSKVFVVGSATILRFAERRSSEADRESATTARRGAVSEEQKNLRCPSVHRKCTNHPQLFHSLDLHRPAHYACNFMFCRTTAAGIAAVALL